MSEGKGARPDKAKSSAVPGALCGLGVLGYASTQDWVRAFVPPDLMGAAEISVAALGAYWSSVLVLAGFRFRTRLKKALDAERPKDSAHSSRIATVRDIEEAGLIKKPSWIPSFLKKAPETVSFYAGIVGRHVLRLQASHVLVIAPSGAGKNIKYVFLLLGLNREPAVVNDVKGENYEVTSEFRRIVLGHRIIRLVAGGDHKYNPLDILKDGLAAGGADVLTDARIIAQALIPEPKDERNSYWRQGGRDLIIIAMVGLAVKDPASANLGNVQSIVTDIYMLIALCEELEKETALSGDLAIIARGFLGMSQKTEKGLQEYINVAKQAMAPYARSGILHKLTERSTFRYRDLKYKDAEGRFLTIYNHFDSSRRVIFEPFGAMLNACMLLELQRDRSPQRWLFINDEAANFVVKDLPKQMTILRGDGNGHIVNITQSRAQMQATWGREGAQVILDNSDIKIIFGMNTDEEAAKVSELIGKQNALTPSYGMGQGAADGISENRGLGQRPVMTADMVRREKRAFVIYKQERVMLVHLPGYQRCEPMRSKFKANSLYSKKRFKEPTEVIF
jgi:type IV secretory pathway TraG/TraD family ATPase VirD4